MVIIAESTQVAREQDTAGQRAVRIGRILDAFVSARQRCEPVSESELYAKHPDIALELRQHLSLLRDLPTPADKIDSLVAQGILEQSDDQRYPAQVGSYKVVDYLGRGGMGIVLRAYERSLNRTVALKILRPELADDRVALERFTREAKAAAALNHPNIVTVHTVGHYRGVPFIAMEYVSGPSLAEAITSRQLSAISGQHVASNPDSVASAPRGRHGSEQPYGLAPASGRWGDSHNPQSGIRGPDTIRHIFRQLLEALAAAHGAGLIHRDVKSSNILLEMQGSRDHGAEGADADGIAYSVKLADFGLARMLSSQTRVTAADSILGTPEYMSPEQARGDGDIDHRTDLYSAGVVLYEMLTGRVPFKADTPSGVIHQVLNLEPPEPRTIDRNADSALASIAMRLLAKRREERFVVVGDALQALNLGVPTVSLPRRRLRHRRISVVSAVVGALLVACWFGRHSLVTEPTITDVQVDLDTYRRILVCYDGDANWRVFPCPIFDNYTGLFSEARLVDLYGEGDCAIAVGVRTSFDGANLFLLDTRGRELKRMDLEPTEEWILWDTILKWNCRRLIAADLDDTPGDEIVAVIGDESLEPCSIVLVNPRTGELISSFRHPGGISGMRLVDRLFDGNRPAIAAWGYNNLLYPPDDDTHRADVALADWNIVSTVFILDPLDMDGAAPSTIQFVRDVPPATPYAYAYLNLQGTNGASSARLTMSASDLGVAFIPDVEMASPSTNDNSGPWYRLMVTRSSVGGGATLLVDKDLNFRNAAITSTEPIDSKSTWCDYWRVVEWRGWLFDN